MDAEVERLAKVIIKKQKSLDTFDEKKEGSSSRTDLLQEITMLEQRLAKRVLSCYK
jgi:hypothetical protein